MRLLRSAGRLLMVGMLVAAIVHQWPSDDKDIRRLGFHQGKTEAYMLYFFISHVYDHILNPWHWTVKMRDEALSHGSFEKGLKTVDVGAGTGFNTEGVLKYASKDDVTMVDQSPHQLVQAEAKDTLSGVKKMIGDAENLPFEEYQFDRWTSAGSIEYWPNPQQGISEAFRVLKHGGKATIIGPVRPTHWFSRFIADFWYLFPTEDEYIKWFEAAGFEDVKLNRVTPEWYKGDRSHGLIMGCVVSGTKPEGDVTPAAPSKKEPISEDKEMPLTQKVLDLALALPRFLLGSIGGLYYAWVPIYFYLLNVVIGPATPFVLAAVLAPLFAWVLLKSLFGGSFRPHGHTAELRDGIANLYDESSDVWERQWGEHMHTGHYGKDGTIKKDHVTAQEDMIEELIRFGGVTSAENILDCGCGIGGSSRFLAKRFGAHVQGITLSPVQVARATDKAAKDEDIPEGRVEFDVQDALKLPYEDNTFDLIWSLESGEHMPEKIKWLEEMRRVLKPGGKFLCATWCHREGPKPLSSSEKKHLSLICKYYSLPRWVPISKYIEICEALGLKNIKSDDWTQAIMPFWPAVVWLALTPTAFLSVLKAGRVTLMGAITAVLMLAGFKRNLLTFGAFVAEK